ncbi:hypothetical protein RRG08_020124 [Elysia crispata]|uniref:Uncharacterized protein n=1 Tax=Elysia crispata TaxID=231223 RepID=A0AAE1DSZ6_9GAST|nr:hypothetical protein RRG08_020124 [Elysia crispata]
MMLFNVSHNHACVRSHQKLKLYSMRFPSSHKTYEVWSNARFISVPNRCYMPHTRMRSSTAEMMSSDLRLTLEQGPVTAPVCEAGPGPAGPTTLSLLGRA